MSDSLVEVIHLLLNPSSDSIKQNNTLSLVRLCLGEPIVPISGEIRHLDHAIDLVLSAIPGHEKSQSVKEAVEYVITQTGNVDELERVLIKVGNDFESNDKDEIAGALFKKALRRLIDLMDSYESGFKIIQIFNGRCNNSVCLKRLVHPEIDWAYRKMFDLAEKEIANCTDIPKLLTLRNNSIIWGESPLVVLRMKELVLSATSTK